jgi:DNA repair protein RadB
MINSDLELLNEVLRGERKEICCVYGEPASGKTTLVKESAINRSLLGKKVVFIDSEKSFSVDRFLQLSKDKKVLDKLLILKPKDLKEQGKFLQNLLSLKDLDLVIVDSLGIFHRYELKKNAKEANNELDFQFNVLSELCLKKVSVLITNQIYKNINENRVDPVGGNMVRNWSKVLIRLEKEPQRKLVLEKPESKEVEFKIVNEGLE